MNKYLKFEYWNTCDLGNIYYQGGQHFWFYLDGDVLEPFHEDIEDGQEDGEGDFIPTYRRQMKRYRIRTSLLSDYLIDAMQRMKLHDHIELTFKTGEIEQIYNLDVEPEWQFEKHCWQGTVTLTFDMDEKVVLGSCCDNLTVGDVIPPEPIPDLYWVADTGSDESGDGSYQNPWATLGYATTQATISGDVIHVKAGTITETVRSSLAVGVSIIGAGDTSILSYTYLAVDNSDACIILHSAAEGTTGNQSISYLKFDGNNTATAAISVKMRNDVICHHLTIVDFAYRGIQYDGSIGSLEPITYMTGAKIYDCNISESSSRSLTYSFGLLNITGTDGMEVYNNTLSQTLRASTLNGNILYMWGGWDKNFKYYNNTSTKPTTDGAVVGAGVGWNFHLESGRSMGGFEIHDNTFIGGVAIDLASGDHVKGASTYSWHVYRNTFKITSQIATQPANTHIPTGIDLERKITDVLIEKNIFENYPQAISCSLDDPSIFIERVHINYNLFKTMGYSDHLYNAIIRFMYGQATCYYRYIYIDNNIIVGNGAEAAVLLNSGSAPISYLYIRNNVIRDIITYGWMRVENAAATFSYVFVQNNDLYNNANSDDILYIGGKTISNLTETNNINTDPAFVGGAPYDYHLAAGSGCINTGLDVGLTTDYDDVAIASPPEIGAYEYIP